MKRKICTLILSMVLSAILLHILRHFSVPKKYGAILVYVTFLASILSVSLSIWEVITNKVTKEIAYELLSTINELITMVSLLIITVIKITWIRRIALIIFFITLILLMSSYKKCRNYEEI